MARHVEALLRADAVGEEREPALRGEARIELAQRPGGGVARIHEGLLARFQRALVDRLEVLAHHQHLAAHLEELRAACACSSRSGIERTVRRLGGHVLARGAVAARGALHEDAVLVDERHREPVELELGGILDLRPPRGPRGSAGRRRRRPPRRTRWRARASARGARPARSLRSASSPRAASASRACELRDARSRASPAPGRAGRTRRRRSRARPRCSRGGCGARWRGAASRLFGTDPGLRRCLVWGLSPVYPRSLT